MTQYTEAQRTEARALAAAIGPVKAAEKLGIPRRTVAYWMHQPAASVVIAAAEHDVAERLRNAHALALAEVTAGLRDPKARLGDKAASLRILGEQLALAEGRATENIAIHDGNEDKVAPFAMVDAETAEYLERIADVLLGLNFETLLAIQEGGFDQSLLTQPTEETTDVG